MFYTIREPPPLCSTQMCFTNSDMRLCVFSTLCCTLTWLKPTLSYAHMCLPTIIMFYAHVFNQQCLPADMCLTNYKLTDGREITINVMQSRISPRIWVCYGNAIIVLWEIKMERKYGKFNLIRSWKVGLKAVWPLAQILRADYSGRF